MLIKNKTKMVQEAMQILQTETYYSSDSPKRVSGYYGLTVNGKCYYDCSSFCATLMKRVFNVGLTINSKTTLNGKSYNNVWRTHEYLDEAHKRLNNASSSDKFMIVDRATTPGEAIDKSKLQIGDFILGDAEKIRDGENHIMFYVGDDYIIHATGKNEGGVIRERLTTEFYTRLETKANVEKGNATKRLDKEVMIIRYRDRELSK